MAVESVYTPQNTKTAPQPMPRDGECVQPHPCLAAARGQGGGAYPALPHGRTRWPHPPVRPLRQRGAAVQLLPDPALPLLPNQREGAVARRTPRRGAARLARRSFRAKAAAVLPRRLHADAPLFDNRARPGNAAATRPRRRLPRRRKTGSTPPAPSPSAARATPAAPRASRTTAQNHAPDSPTPPSGATPKALAFPHSHRGFNPF